MSVFYHLYELKKDELINLDRNLGKDLLDSLVNHEVQTAMKMNISRYHSERLESNKQDYYKRVLEAFSNPYFKLKDLNFIHIKVRKVNRQIKII